MGWFPRHLQRLLALELKEVSQALCQLCSMCHCFQQLADSMLMSL